MNPIECTGEVRCISIIQEHENIELLLKRMNFYSLNVLFIGDLGNETIRVLGSFDIEKWHPIDIILENDYQGVGKYLSDFGYTKINETHYRRDYYKTFHGEIKNKKYTDEILRDYFPDYSYVGTFVDVGAYDPIFISNSYHFEKNGWNVFCIEANPDLIPMLRKHRKNVYNYAVYDTDQTAVTFNVVYGPWGSEDGTIKTAGCSAIELNEDYLRDNSDQITKIEKIEVEQITLNTFFSKVGFDNLVIDILKIDVEGGEFKVLKGIDLKRYRPRMILIEDPYHNEEMHKYLTINEYALVDISFYNKYYVSI
jgi:FkbM family methyltransferase